MQAVDTDEAERLIKEFHLLTRLLFATLGQSVGPRYTGPNMQLLPRKAEIIKEDATKLLRKRVLNKPVLDKVLATQLKTAYTRMKAAFRWANLISRFRKAKSIAVAAQQPRYIDLGEEDMPNEWEILYSDWYDFVWSTQWIQLAHAADDLARLQWSQTLQKAKRDFNTARKETEHVLFHQGIPKFPEGDPKWQLVVPEQEIHKHRAMLQKRKDNLARLPSDDGTDMLDLTQFIWALKRLFRSTKILAFTTEEQKILLSWAVKLWEDQSDIRQAEEEVAAFLEKNGR